jgi:kynurenine formamidase
MKITVSHHNKNYQVDLNKPLDISIPLEEGLDTVNCFYAPPMETSPVIAGDFIGSTQMGGLLNFLNVKINPHGNGTHTECVGHIAKKKFTINKSLQQYHFMAKLVSVFPRKIENGDRVIFKDQIEAIFKNENVNAIVIRTLPNDDLKMKTNYSGAKAIRYLIEQGVEHLLIDLPSVDREEDGGKLLSHRAFWQYPDNIRENCTITELIYAKNEIKDGLYLLNIQTASFEIDVSPSKPVLYELMPEF